MFIKSYKRFTKIVATIETYQDHSWIESLPISYSYNLTLLCKSTNGYIVYRAKRSSIKIGVWLFYKIDPLRFISFCTVTEAPFAR